MGAQFNIKDAETIRLCRELADKLGGSVTAAIRGAVEDKIAFVDKVAAKPTVDEIMALARDLEGHWKPEFDGQELSLTHGDLLYDEFGAPK